jgi:hypothetical protein
LPRLGTSERVAPLCAQNAGLVWLDGVLAHVTVLSDALAGVNGQLSEVNEINDLVRVVVQALHLAPRAAPARSA